MCFWPSFRYSNYSNNFMVEYSNSKIGIRHRPIDDVYGIMWRHAEVMNRRSHAAW